MNNKIQQILNSMETYQLSSPEDTCIVVADTEKVVGYLPGKKVDLKVKVGTPIEMFKGAVAYKAFETGKVVH